MPDNTYPLFESGQTLTATDLNLLRGFLHERDRLVGRMIGFGINAGLSGTVVGSTLTIQPGLAVDQVGEPLVLPTEQTIALPPTPVTPSYDFISGTQGFSVVLEATETVDPAPDCGESPSCAGHAEHHTRGVELRVVRGRLSGLSFDFSKETLIQIGPMRLDLSSSPVTPFNSLRKEIADRLDNVGGTPRIDPDLILDLRSRTIAASDSPAIKGYKVGYLNMVLFATLDLLRVEALLALTWNRVTDRPGVVLGWLEPIGSSFVFHCGYRHAWEPPRGFTEAFLGGSCSDPAALYRERLEELIAGWAPPEPPPSGGGPVEPPVLHCPPGTIRVNGVCRHIYFPPPEIPDWWADPWVGPLDPLGPIWNPPPFEDPGWLINPVDIYGGYPVDFFGDGELGGLQYVGQPAAEVEDVLIGFIGEEIADVRVMTHTAAQGLDGYLPSSSFSPSDTIVISQNTAGEVIAIGRVPAARNTSRVATALPAAEAAVTEARDVAQGLSTLAEGLKGSFTALDGKLTNLDQSFQSLLGDFNDYKGGAFDVSGYGVRIGELEKDFIELGGHGQRIASLEGKVQLLDSIGVQVDEVGKFSDRVATLEAHVADAKFGERIATLEGQVGFFGKEIVGRDQIKGMSPAVARGFSEFAETTVSAVRSLEKSGALTERYARDVERAHAAFEVEVASGQPELIGGAAIGLMKSLRTMVKAASKDTVEGATIGSQLDAQIRHIEELYG